MADEYYGGTTMKALFMATKEQWIIAGVVIDKARELTNCSINGLDKHSDQLKSLTIKCDKIANYLKIVEQEMAAIVEKIEGSSFKITKEVEHERSTTRINDSITRSAKGRKNTTSKQVPWEQSGRFNPLAGD